MPADELALMQAPTANQQLDKLYNRHHGWLQGWLQHKLGSLHDAEDLAQDTFVRIIRSPLKEGSLREPRHYLLTIARGLTVDLFRRRTLERQYQQALAALPENQWPSEEARLLILESLMEIDALFSGLGAKVKHTFILSQCEGLTYAEIADQLGISLRTVNNYMATAMEHCCLYRLKNDL
ncbi:MAG: RNA polymerase subunit sigma [Gammaproteobacteria bacterium]|nr:MAG: RNA polymerase subunit sigma [Gammaproteobacteria bacterium]